MKAHFYKHLLEYYLIKARLTPLAFAFPILALLFEKMLQDSCKDVVSLLLSCIVAEF